MSNSASELPRPSPRPAKVAGRYQIQRCIARGGMGEVFVAIDTATDQRVALKRLNDRTIDSVHVEQLFQLEYQTLRQLQHPHIIEVYDYGVDEGGPYYTMELLDGHDLHRLAPLPYRLVCRYLRDVAASLALLHTRGVAHRDLSPKNVRVTSDGHCKLIDFGAMAHFGAVAEPAGTPPVVAPEVVRGVPIDHRVDLYALGALAYWLLTGRHAYHAERIVQLPEAWRKPPKPIRSLVQDVPGRLEQLVMRLIDLDPGARPPSVGYVIEELTTVGQLQPDDSLDDARAFVAMPTLAGREREMEQLRRALRATADAEGCGLLIESNPGVGRTRLLAELAVHAQLSGMLLSHVDAGKYREPLQTARALLRGALRNVPDRVRDALDQDALSLLLPVPSQHAKPPPPPGDAAGVTRLQTAFVACCKRLARERPLVLLLDDVHRADTESIACLSALAVEAPQLSVLLVCTEERSAVFAAGGALESFNARCEHIPLQPLTEEDTAGLLRAMFGDVPNIAILGRWMHAVSLGNPGDDIELAFHLVEHSVLRYLDGRWLIPAQMPDMELPDGLTDSVRLRARQVSMDSRELAEHLALLQGAAPVPLCAVLMGSQQRATDALEELSGLGILVRNESGYAFSRELLRKVILEGVDDERRRAQHRAIGEALLSVEERGTVDEIRAGLHLIRGGEAQRGADMLVRRAERAGAHRADLPGAVEGLHAALEVYERAGRSETECLRVRARLVMWATAAGSPLADRYGDSTLAVLFELAGLGWATRLSRFVGGRLSLMLGSAVAWLVRLSRFGRSPAPSEALLLLSRVAPALATARLFNLDDVGVRALSRFVAPLADAVSGAQGNIAHRFVRALSLYASHRLSESRRLLESLLSTLDGAPGEFAQAEVGFDVPTQARLLLAIQYARAGDPAALKLADELEARGSALGLSSAKEARLIFHLMRGEREVAREVRSELEQLAIMRGGVPIFEAFNQLHLGVVSSLAGDLLALKSAIDALEHAAMPQEHLDAKVRLLRGGYLVAAGRTRQGVEELGKLVAERPPWSSSHWCIAHQLHASGLAQAGRGDEARKMLEDMERVLVGHVPDTDIAAVSLQWLLASRDIAVGKGDAAFQRMERVIARLEAHQAPMFLGRSHELAARATVVRGEGFRPQYLYHLGEARRLYAEAGNPLLVAQAEGLAQDVTERRPFSAPPTGGSLPGPSPSARTLAPGRGNSTGSALARAKSAAERAQICLSVVVSRSAAPGGIIYLQGMLGLHATASVGGEADAPELLARVRAFLEMCRANEEGVEAETEVVNPDDRHELHALSFRDDGGTLHLVGVIALVTQGSLRAPGARVLENLARELMMSGDVITAI